MSTLIARSRNTLMERQAHVLARNHSRNLDALEMAEDRTPDVLDEAAATETAALLGQLVEAHQRELKAIDRALRRMASGTWGVCHACRRRISAARLRVAPESNTCIECAAAAAS